MEEIKIKGIVLKSVDFGDSDKLVTIFSAEKGILTAKARGVKKPKAKLAFAAQPFAFVEFILFRQGDFFSIKTATSIDQFFDITLDFDRYILMLSILEIISKTMKQNAPDPEVFLLLLSALEAAVYKNANPMLVFIKFMIELMKLLGFEINFLSCASCDCEISEPYAFSFDLGGMLCKKCQRRNDFLELSAGEYAVLKNVSSVQMRDLSTLKFLSRDDVVSGISLLIKNFRLNLDEDVETIKQFL